tara:strand:- start:1 stop:243 length:243 start_codon:yes stop_codon:yes gene_type:complete
MEHLVKLLRNSYDLQEEKSEQSAYWHLQQLRSQIKQLIIQRVSNRRELLIAYEKKRSETILMGDTDEDIVDEIMEAINCC